MMKKEVLIRMHVQAIMSWQVGIFCQELASQSKLRRSSEVYCFCLVPHG